MGKSLERNDSFAPGNFPGCITGIFQILDYHHWHVKKLLPHKKHTPRSRGVKGNQTLKVVLKNHDQVFMDADSEVEPLLAKQHDTNSVPARKRKGKTRSKFPSKENHRSWILWFSLHTWLQRINPVHHLDPFENCYDDIDSHDNKSAQKRNDTNKYNDASKDASDHQLGECVDVLEIFKVNKDFFLKILQDRDDCMNQPHGLKNSNIKVKLSKSMSFPVANLPQDRLVANSPQARLVRPSSLKHKQSEVWFSLNGDNSAVDSRTEGETKETQGSSGLSSSHGHGWNQVVTTRFRDIKEKIKHALKEGKREKVNPFEATEILERKEKTIDQDSNEVDGLSDNDLGTRKFQGVRRTSLLNDSIHRYAHLFNNTSSRDTKYTHSRSLTLSTSEVKAPSQSLKERRRNLSLPDIDSMSSLLNVSSVDALCLARAYSRASVDYSADSTVNENDKEMSFANETPEPARESGVCQEEEEVFLEAETEMAVSHDTELDSKCVQAEGLDCYDHIDENEDFKYVRQILEWWTFTGGNEASTWNSLEQPLSPSLFKHLENQSHSFEDEINHNDHQLLFDLVNEILSDVNEKSYTYFPRPTGKSLLKDVWSKTSWYMSLRPEQDKSLDDVVGRDLAKSSGKWMNLEWEREMVALELEDLFFDELLEQVLSCLD